MEKLSGKNHLYIIILAGGGGTRLWPKSRIRKPKQFLKLTGKRSLLEETFKRVEALVPLENIYIVTSGTYGYEIKKELNNFSPENILVEPESKNTAAAIGLGIAHICKKDNQAIIASLASDHLVKKPKEFREVLKAAFLAGNKGDFLLTVGIHPTKPDTGLGYIHIEKKILEVNKKSFFKVESFKEKPDLATAQAFLVTQEYFWNASYFIGKSKTFLEAYKKYLPRHYKVIQKIIEAKTDTEEKEILFKSWPALDDTAIDYGIMERADNLLMIPGDFGWSDVGNWAIIHEVFEPTKEGNVFVGNEEGKHLSLDTRECLVHSNGRLIATVGLSGMIIVDTLDVLLICPKERASDVKKLVEILRKEKRFEYL